MNAFARSVAEARAFCDAHHVPAFLLLQALAALVATWIFAARIEPRRRAVLVFGFVTGTPAGAIALGLAIRSNVGWLSAWGALAGAMTGVALASVLTQRRALDAVDALAPALGALVAIGRLGCLIAGCDHGAPVRAPPSWPLPWAVPHVHDGTLVHPTQLYESLLGVVMIIVAERALRRRDRGGAQGAAIAAALAVYAGGRFFIEMLRGDVRPTSAGLTVGQWLAVGAVAFIVALVPSHRTRVMR